MWQEGYSPIQVDPLGEGTIAVAIRLFGGG
jgi:hypothetical protein